MRAVAFTSFGGPEVLSVVDVARPEPLAGQVRIRVQAAPVQPADLAVRSGAFGPMVPPGPTYVPGWDVAGVVDAVGPGVEDLGPGVEDLGPGQPVVGLSDWLATRVGTHAEFVVLPATALAPAPARVTPQEAATLPANALTAVQALDLLGLARGQTLAITGAGGAVGGYAVELARLRGIRVLAIGSAPDERFLTSRDARYVPRSDDPAGALRAITPDGVDGLLDAAVLGTAVLGAVRDGGVFVSVIPPATPPAERGIRMEIVGLHSDGAQLRELVRLVERGHLTLRVADVLPFEQASEAHARFAKGGLRGRIVLVP
ncbi:NADP-dependent oxidoreductase [Plantactinospora solaniradicis]|uniref:NADP-dependent oxidoreductase n=1 Tax=Plantactinospora solaniradicis TaxID=1723736 RepID=A0ABW1K8S9_9ACTN